MPPNLTFPQRDVLRLICTGQATAQIADSLQISVNTVEAYRKNPLWQPSVKKRPA